jgi:hypothetical protein
MAGGVYTAGSTLAAGALAARSSGEVLRSLPKRSMAFLHTTSRCHLSTTLQQNMIACCAEEGAAQFRQCKEGKGYSARVEHAQPEGGDHDEDAAWGVSLVRDEHTPCSHTDNC